MEEQVRHQLQNGAYDRLGTLESFTEKLTEDLRSVSHDPNNRFQGAGSSCRPLFFSEF